MKVLSWVFGFFIGGFILGLMLFSGATFEMKHSQSSQISFIIPLIIGVVCGIIGAVFATNMIADEKKRIALGLDKINTSKYKDGRKWVYQSNWINPTTNTEYIIKTFYEKGIDSTISTLNGELYLNHNSNSGAEVFVAKVHNSVKGLVITQILKEN